VLIIDFENNRQDAEPAKNYFDAIRPRASSPRFGSNESARSADLGAPAPTPDAHPEPAPA
jgi:hypothetical protein